MYKKAPLLLILLGLALGASNRVHIALREPHPLWNIVADAQDRQPVQFTIFLKEQNLDKLQAIFEAVSNPDHANWGNFMTQAEIEELTRPDEACFNAIDTWFAPFRTQMRVEKFANSIEVSTTAKIASALFDAPFKVFEHISGEKSIVRASGSLTVPDFVRPHIEIVAGLTELFTGKIRSNANIRGTENTRAPQPSPNITPAILKQYYNVPSTLQVTNPSNLQAIAAFDDEFSIGALRQFEKANNLQTANVSRIGPDCLAEGCDQMESDLDVQFITGLAQGANTLFISQGQNYWILQTLNELLNQINPKPYVISFSYGWSELQQCDIAVANCPALGYNSQQYVQATDTIFMKLGTMGLSALVSDGDDGAASLGAASGNCPIDPKQYCVIGGCAHTTTACPAITISNSTGGLCFFPNGIGSNACAATLQDQNVNTALQAFAAANSNCNFNLEADSQNNQHVYSSCACSQMQSASGGGYTISGYVFNQNNGPVFTADFPTSSPYVTSVGATQLVGSNPSKLTEIVASIATGAAITTGGGFSAFQAAPSYQNSAVSAWLSTSNLPPSWSFNSQMRGYPDVAFCGHSYVIYASNDNSDNCPCQAEGVDGTSASSPAFAALVTLINDNLLNNKKSPLGFLNPLLYKMAAENPSSFNQITSGNNNCNRAYCCQYGYSASSGIWDPVTGLGSPNFGNMLSYISNLKAISK
jgi:subtilase family serine protease